MMFPERIKYLRQTQGINQVQLAEAKHQQLGKR